ncbi:MAG: recombination mediator RecR [Bacteroidales bacterium]|nr:recombination mediator RecR [Bacteroidales bacterium]
MNLPSRILEQAVEQLSTLPGVGKRSALRYALHLMKQDEMSVRDLSEALLRLKTDLHRCRYCHNVSDTEVCPVCSSEKRQKGIVCVVENVQDVMAIENTQQYRGLYHVLGGVISPIDGIGVGDLEIASLLHRVECGDPAPVEEVILALPTTMEGDTTNFYLSRQLRPMGVKITTLARGVAVGDSLEYADEITLGRSIAGRIPFEG